MRGLVKYRRGSEGSRFSSTFARAGSVGQGQRGSTLIVALLFVGLFSLIVATLLTFATTSVRSTEAYRSQRDSGYDADGAIKAAVNWAKDQPDECIHPDYQVGTSEYDFEGVATGDLTVTCEGEADGEYGKPKEPGLVPPEALLMLGTRHNEPGPYNTGKCTGAFDTLGGWISDGVLGFLGLSDLAAVGSKEPSGFFGPKRYNSFWSCGTANRSFNEFAVEGKVVAAGTLRVPNGTLTAVKPDNSLLTGGVVARYGCDNPSIEPDCLTGANVPTRSGYTGVESYLNGTAVDTDPGRTNPASPAQNPTDIAAPFAPLPIAGLPVRTSGNSGQAYFLNEDGTLTETDTCSGSDRTVVFLPGWYRSATYLNSFTTSAACNDTTFWFSPDPGDDNRLLTDDDEPGAFLLDFRQGTASECRTDFATVARWCIGGSNAQNARVVVGQPEGWSPVDPWGTGVQSTTRKPVSIDTATTIDDDLSVKWHNAGNAGVFGGGFATYTPCTIFGLFNCPSLDRAIRLRDFTPDVTGPPVSEAGQPKGKLFITVAYGLENGAALNPEIVVEAVSKQSGRKSCGTYPLEKKSYNGSGAMPTATLTDTQAIALAAACGSVDHINGLEVKFQAKGNFFNSGSPKIYLDGVKIHYDTFGGASFPQADPGSDDQFAAKSDCDPDLPGAQLIFTGQSHVNVADGSLEVCAGPYPTSPMEHQSIGIYGVPAVSPVVPADAWLDGGTNASINYTGAAAASRLRIGEPGGRQDVEVKYGNYTGYDVMGVGGLLRGVEGRMKVRMNAYQPPAGFQVKRVDMRVSYNTHNSCFLWCLFSATSKLNIGGYGDIELPRNPSLLQYANNATVNLYDSAAGGDKINPAGALAAGTQDFTFKPRMTCILAVVVFTCGESRDQLEGIELDITLEPTAANANTPMLIPQSGCITAHPNYEAGASGPDCAMVKADSMDSSETYNVPFSSNREGYWVGRMSVKGTIYAPSAVVEIDDADNAYPLATRGAILRHLRVSGWKFRPGYLGTPFSNNIDRTPNPRLATFVARDDAGEVRAAARVQFDVAGSAANVPRIQWWSTDNG